MFHYHTAHTTEDFSDAARLFKEYAMWLNIDLSFQHFEEELSQIAQMYASPDGGIILCSDNDMVIACVGIRRLDVHTAEMKRMYVQPAYQRQGIATELLRLAQQIAFECGYDAIKLDTLSTMHPAINLYQANGFIEIAGYYYNPNKTVVYFEKDIAEL